MNIRGPPGCFADILAGAAEALYEHDRRAVLGPTRRSRAREMSLLGQLAGGAADGAIIVSPEEASDEFAALAARGFPVVIIDPRTEITDGIPVVSAAHSAGATQATRHLLGLGHRRIDAYLWVKTPGQSDGQCDSAGGARAWDYSDYSQPGWPTTAAAQSLFDPLWGTDDPAAGDWFPQQALQLAQLASPPRPGS